MKKILLFFLISVVILMIPASLSSGTPHNPVIHSDNVSVPQLSITTSMPNSNDIRSLPANASNIEEYPIWNVTFYTSLPYSITINNKVMETGSGPITVTLNLTQYENSGITANITIGKTVYHYENIKITGLPPTVGIQYATVISYYPGEKQYLYGFAGQTGELMYPHWEIYLFSSFYYPYSVYENGTEIFSGHIVGSKTLYLNLTGSVVSVIVSIGPHVYNYKNEDIATVPLNKYYAPPPPPLIFDMYQYERGLALAVLASFMSLSTAMILVRKAVREKEATKASLIWRP